MINYNKVITASHKGIYVKQNNVTDLKFINYEKNDVIEKKVINNKFIDNKGFNLNLKQVKLYRLAVYGLKALTEEELNNISYQDLKKIELLQKKSQVYLNRLKQQKTNIFVDNFLKSLFPNSKIINEFSNDSLATDDSIINNFDFKDLKISRADIINKLIEHNCLPKNFYNL